MSASTSTPTNNRRLVQVAADTWEPTVLVWTQIDPSVAVWSSDIGTIRGNEADGFVGTLSGFGPETENQWAFARAERELIALHEALQPEPVITAEVSFTREQGIRLCSVLFDSIGHAKQGIKDATSESEVTWWESRIDIAGSAYKAISDAIGAFDAEVAR